MKLGFSTVLFVVGFGFVAACGSESAFDSSTNHAGTAGLPLNVLEPDAGMGGLAGAGNSLVSDAGSAGAAAGAAGEAGAINEGNPRQELKPVLLYVASSDGGKALFSWDMSNAAPVNISGPSSAGHAVDEFVVAPDGLRVAFINRSIKEEAGEVYVVDADGSHLKRLSGAAVAHIYPSNASWSAQGSYVLYSTDDVDNPDAPLTKHAFDAKSGSPIAIHGLLSPDEAREVVYEQGAIAVQATDGSHRVELAKSKEEPHLSWSADGRMLSAWTKADGQSVMSADGERFWRLNYCDESPTWAPKGQWLAFVRKEQYFVQTPGSEELAISDPDARGIDWQWAPDGSRIAISQVDLKVFSVKTGEAEQVNASLPAGAALWNFSWSPDAQYVAYNVVGTKSDEGTLFVAHPGETNMAISDHPTGAISSIAWSPNSEYVAYRDAVTKRSWYVASLLGQNTFVGDGVNAAWSADGQFFAVEPSKASPSIRVLRLEDKEIIGLDGPSDGQDLTFALARK